MTTKSTGAAAFMTHPLRAALLGLLATGLIVQAAPAAAGDAASLTPRSSIMTHDAIKKTVELPGFRLGGRYDLDADPASWRNGGDGGTTLESLGAGPLRLGYIAVGTPHRGADGRIDNAVVINTFYSGDATFMYNTWYEGQAANAFSGGAVVGPGRIIDTDRHYVVFLDAIGLWGASKPSDGLGRRFPQYSYQDMVAASHRLLTEHLDIGRVQLVTGCSMGGTQTWVWGTMYSPSGFVEAIMPIGGTTASDNDDPVGQWTFRLAQAAIESDPVWQETGGNYYHLPVANHPKQGLAFMWSVLQLTGLTFPVRSASAWANVEKEVFYWSPTGNQTASFIARTRNEDPVDFWYRNQAGFGYNINAMLPRITARTLVLHVENDQWLMVENARAAAAKVRDAAFVGFADPTAHYAVFKAPNVLEHIVRPFVENRFSARLASMSTSATAKTAASAKPAGLAK